MASSDYKLCDLCGAKTFYDANIEDERYRQTWGARSAYDPIGLKAICGTCNKTHEVIIVPRIATPDPLSDPRVTALVEAVQIDAIRAALEAAAAVAEDAESGLCQRCGHPRNNHPYRHPFIGFALGDLPAAIRAIDPAAIAAKLKGDGNDRA